MCHLPDGEGLYRYHVLAHTTLDEDPRSIHEYGLARLDGIEAASRKLAGELGHATIGDLRRALDSDPANHATEPAELVRIAEEYIARTEAVAPRWFGRLPSDRCTVRPVEPHMEQEAPPAFYMPPSEDGSRKGVYYINTFDPGSRPLHRLAATTFHEAVPGHHFQIALEQELAEPADVPPLRLATRGRGLRRGLGPLRRAPRVDEMGLYHTPRERFGAAESEAWRAVRLVVDTGIHALGWTRQQSIDLLRERAGLSQLEAETETDRYISWPGQALAYMIGQREILDLRADLDGAPGRRSTSRRSTTRSSAHGALPLATLREQLPGWLGAGARS